MHVLRGGKARVCVLAVEDDELGVCGAASSEVTEGHTHGRNKGELPPGRVCGELGVPGVDRACHEVCNLKFYCDNRVLLEKNKGNDT